jgi:hypothetical protein
MKSFAEKLDDQIKDVSSRWKILSPSVSLSRAFGLERIAASPLRWILHSSKVRLFNAVRLWWKDRYFPTSWLTSKQEMVRFRRVGWRKMIAFLPKLKDVLECVGPLSLWLWRVTIVKCQKLPVMHRKQDSHDCSGTWTLSGSSILIDEAHVK